MSSTLGEMKTLVARDLRDPNNKVFTNTVVGDMVNDALTEVGRIIPEQFQEDITPTADTLEYTLRASVFGGAVPEITLKRVEIWDGTTSPESYVGRVRPISGEYRNDSANGWEVWGGILHIPGSTESEIIPATHLIRVWGYSPYPPLVVDADVLSVSNEVQWAMRYYCQVSALRRLTLDRDLFTQWQTHANNSDVSPAGLQNMFNGVLEEWRRRERRLTVLREAP